MKTFELQGEPFFLELYKPYKKPKIYRTKEQIAFDKMVDEMQLKLDLKRKVGRPRIHKVKPKSNRKQGPQPINYGEYSEFTEGLKWIRQKALKAITENRKKHGENFKTDFVFPKGKPGSELDILKKAIEQNFICKMTGLKMILGRMKPKNEQGKGWTEIPDPRRLTIDRIDPDPKVGYVWSNIQLVCWQSNRAKGENTETEMTEMCFGYVKTFIKNKIKALLFLDKIV